MQDSVISILLHFIMPLSIISTDYMQLDLLYSFFIVCMDRHKKIQVTNTQIYVCVFIQHEGKGSDWHYMATRGGGSQGWAPLSKAATQSLSPPLPQVTLSNKKEQNKNQRIKRGKQVN